MYIATRTIDFSIYYLDSNASFIFVYVWDAYECGQVVSVERLNGRWWTGSRQKQ